MTGHRMQYALLSALVLIFSVKCVDTTDTSTPPGSLSCERVTLGSESATKWTVSCTTTTSSVTAAASFDPSVVENYIVNSGAYVTPTSSYDLNLSSTFSKVDGLVSPTITSFSLSAASGYTPVVPVDISSSAFAKLSVLTTLDIQGIPLADSSLHLVLPSSIQNLSIVDCGLSNLSFEFADGSPIADSSLASIDLRHNALNAIPSALYLLPATISTIDLRGNDEMDLSTETSTQQQQLASWIAKGVLLIDSNPEKRTSVVGAVIAAENSTTTESESGNTSIASLPGNTEVSEERASLGVIPIAIISVAVPTVLLIGVAVAFVVRRRRRRQNRESDGILDLPHPFERHLADKTDRDRTETSGHFTAIDSELSRSRMSTIQESENIDSSVAFAESQGDIYGNRCQHQEMSTSVNAGYINLESPLSTRRCFSLTSARRQLSSCEDDDRDHSLELLSTHSNSSTTPAQTRRAARKALRSALEALMKNSSDDSNATAVLTVKSRQYAFSRGAKIEETPLAFFVPCQLVRTKDVEDATSDPAPPTTLALKLFIEEDADLAGRESYALSSIQHDETTRAFVPQLFDEALEYELEVGTINNAVDVVKLNCCILVLETPSGIALGAHMAASQQPTPPQITRIVAAVQALHTRGLVHGALHTDSFVVCSSNNQLKFWGLEYASRSGHMVPCPDAELLESSKAEYVAPESVSATLDHMSSSRASPALDVWSLGVMILKMFAAGEKLVEFQDCVKPGDIFQLLNETETDSNTCFFELSIAAFVSDEDVKDLLRHCFHWNPLSRPSVDNILMHKAFQVKEREVSRRTRVKSRKISQELSAIVEEQALLEASGNPERKTSTKRLPICEEEEQEQDNQLESGAACDDVAPEPMPPSLWLFLPPTELELDLNEDASFSIEQWVSKLKRLQQQRAEEIRFPLVFMCEVCDSTTAVPCNITTTKFGTSVPSSLLPLVMPLVRETMLFLEARAILSDGLSVGETSGLAGPREWEELRTFYSALEYMELATVNPVNEVMFAPMELQLQSRDPSKAQQVLDELKGLVFSEEKREHVRNLLNALASDEKLEAQVERDSWASLRRCDVTRESTRWLCSHHAP